VIFIPYREDCYDASEEDIMRFNDGKNDITTIKMWALFDKVKYYQEVWSFFSPCISERSQDANKYTTSIIGEYSCD